MMSYFPNWISKLFILAAGLALSPIAVSANDAAPEMEDLSYVDSSSQVDASDLNFADEPVFGWAAVKGMGRDTTTGGAGGKTVTVKNSSDFKKYASQSGALTIILDGNIQGSFRISSNKTIIGKVGSSIQGSIGINGKKGSYVSNIILKNLKIVGWNCKGPDAGKACKSGSDAVSVTWAHHLWFDHCDISDGSDGNLDFTHAVDFVTVSWTIFSYSTPKREHRFSNLVGSSDTNGGEDSGHLNTTFASNWWKSGVDQRMPRTRFGKIHIFNNLYTSKGNSYCINSGKGASLLVENNFFSDVNDPYTISSGGGLKEKSNVYERSSGRRDQNGKGFVPTYAYSLTPAPQVETMVRSGAGVK